MAAPSLTTGARAGGFSRIQIMFAFVLAILIVTMSSFMRQTGEVDDKLNARSAKRWIRGPVFLGKDLYDEVEYEWNTTRAVGRWFGQDVPLCEDQIANGGAQGSLALRRCLPSYIIIGALKGGTSSMYKYLIAHPNVKKAVKKEICYLRFHRNISLRNITNYRQQFLPWGADDNDRTITGEGCPFYFPDLLVAKIVKQVLPNVRLILMLRDPVDRLLSMFNMRVRYKNDGFLGGERLEDYITCIRDRMYGPMTCDSPHIGTRNFIYEGKYALHLKLWIDEIPLSPKYLIARSEDFYKNESFIMKETYAHMGLPPYEIPAHELKVVNGAPPGKKVGMPQSLRDALVEFYHPYNMQLYEMLGRDFGWDRPKDLDPFAKDFSLVPNYPQNATKFRPMPKSILPAQRAELDKAGGVKTDDKDNKGTEEKSKDKDVKKEEPKKP